MSSKKRLLVCIVTAPDLAWPRFGDAWHPLQRGVPTSADRTSPRRDPPDRGGAEPLALLASSGSTAAPPSSARTCSRRPQTAATEPKLGIAPFNARVGQD